MKVWTAEAWERHCRDEEIRAHLKVQTAYDGDTFALDREIARDLTDNRSTSWSIFMSEFFATCRATGETPWRNTGLHPMTFASRLYHEQQDMQQAFIDNGMWEPDTLQVPDPSFTSIDPDQVFCEVDWDDHVTYQAAA